MRAIGIDVGSTATKAVVVDTRANTLEEAFCMPTGFSSIDAAERCAAELAARGYDITDCTVTATGYGRVAVPYAGTTVTEITCHAAGAAFLFGSDGVVIDVGGQDTKVIRLEGGKVKKFAMNDKCAAGTGKFLEVMANRMGVSQDDLSALARTGSPTSISSMCTVFAESEVISLIGKGEPRSNIAYAIYDSVVQRVAALAAQMPGEPCFLTGGLCDNGFFIEQLGRARQAKVTSRAEARFAGAIGAAFNGAKQA